MHMVFLSAGTSVPGLSSKLAIMILRDMMAVKLPSLKFRETLTASSSAARRYLSMLQNGLCDGGRSPPEFYILGLLNACIFLAPGRAPRDIEQSKYQGTINTSSNSTSTAVYLAVHMCIA
ncbi:hypothetical protein AcW1_007280 [Taiwanofungus camphoratus]|nr:hypothetical protein AcW1_007280 [Antrodia cinnamomea]